MQKPQAPNEQQHYIKDNIMLRGDLFREFWEHIINAMAPTHKYTISIESDSSLTRMQQQSKLNNQLLENLSQT